MERIAFQGAPGAFSEQAIYQLLGRRVALAPCESFEKTFAAVLERRAQACVVPVENTLAGSVHKNLDLLLQHRFTIRGETQVRIEHHLIALPGVQLRDIRRVISHPVALEQCQNFFRAHPGIRSEVAYDTAGSVKQIVEHRWRDTAAIAGPLAARRYRCAILKRNLEDHRENFTRFWLLARKSAKTPAMKRATGARANRAKTSTVFATKNIPGALFKCLSVFALRDINLTKIESRPRKGRPFEYFFYVDFLGNVAEERCRNALRHLSEITDFLRVLGCYRKG